MPQKWEVYERLVALEATLKGVVERDAEQEVQGIALPVVDAAFEAARDHLTPDDPLVKSSYSVLSAEIVDAGEPLRAVDALVVVSQLRAALHEPPRPATVSAALLRGAQPTRRRPGF